MSLRKVQHDVFKMFMASVQAVCPEKLVLNALEVKNDKMVVKEKQYNLHNNVYVVAFGKAVYSMVKAVEYKLGSHIVQGVASVPHAANDNHRSGRNNLASGGAPSTLKKVEIICGAKDNFPDEDAQIAAARIMKIAQKVSCDDILLVLVSGGGSALLPLPVAGITLREKMVTTKVLSRNGASIFDLNTVRKQLSQIKGGKLAEAAYPAQVVTLILSDVLGDPLDIIACGPTVPNSTTKHDALHIVQKFDTKGDIPENVTAHLKSPETALREICDFSHVQNLVIGNNKVAVGSAAKLAESLGYSTYVHSTEVSGDARVVGRFYADLAEHIADGKRDFASRDQKFNDFLDHSMEAGKPICIIGAGETTVSVRGTGMGGRNQELALAASTYMHKISKPDKDIVLLSAGTDGQDGPTPATGAYAFPQLVTRAVAQGLDPVAFLNNNDSYSFYSQFDNGNYSAKTGLTGTNVMDLQILVVSPNS